VDHARAMRVFHRFENLPCQTPESCLITTVAGLPENEVRQLLAINEFHDDERLTV
jgi:hypothetical protein